MLQGLLSTAAGAGNLFGGILANDMNRSMSNKQMRFQKYMSSTAHQREVADLEKAGLNPILSANTGASTPTGAQPNITNPMSGVMDSAMNTVSALTDAALKMEQGTLVRAQQTDTKAATQLKNIQTSVTKKGEKRGEATNKIWDIIDRVLDKQLDSAAKSKKRHKERYEAEKQLRNEHLNNMYMD